jgi:DDE superfamily endonuclease
MVLLYFFLLVWPWLCPEVAAASDLPFFVQANFITISTALLLCVTPEIFGDHDVGSKRKEERSSYHIKRVRKSVNEIFAQLGPHYVRRAYRMDEASFWKLCRILRPHLQGTKRKIGKNKSKPQRNGAKNGIIPSPTKVSVALRYFAGGSAYDIATTHGISHTDVFRSVWKVVDAVNKCSELSFNFPDNHAEQRKIAAGFQQKSKAQFTGCCGCIDGILIWMEKPSEKSCEEAECGGKKFFCGRKKKFGLNMQAIVDHHKRFLHMSVYHPASTSDYLAFSTMDLFHKLERPGFLADGVHLFGDNAYVSTPYMATPYKNVKSGLRDDYNFYHSQVRINVECAFGMFVQRWGVLRRALSAKVTTKKVNCLCMALCRLHNFCINSKLKPSEQVRVTPVGAEVQDDLRELASDSIAIAMNGGVDIQSNGIPTELLHGGEHFDDLTDRNMLRWRKKSGEILPRESMCNQVEQLGLKRPTPNRWQHKTPSKHSN